MLQIVDDHADLVIEDRRSSSKLTLCFRRLAFAFQSSHSNFSDSKIASSNHAYSFSNNFARGSWLFSLASSRMISRLRSSLRCGTATSTVTI